MKKINKKGFSIIEVLVGIVIFLFGITGVYTLIHSTLFLNDYNKNYIIGVNLAREQLELFRNVRDSNFKNTRNYLIYDLKDKDNYSDDEKFFINNITQEYKISNNFNSQIDGLVSVEQKNFPSDYKTNLAGNTNIEDFQVCLFEFDESGTKYNLYDYCKKEGSSGFTGKNIKKLKIYKFIELSEVPGYTLEQAVKVKSKVIWYSKRISEFEVEEIFTNYKIY